MSSNLREKRSAVILLAGGQSLRMGGVDKLWLELDGRPIIDFSFDWILDREFVFESGLSQVVVVISDEGYKKFLPYLTAHKKAYPDVEFGRASPGRSRQESVSSGLDEVDIGADLIFVHDAARPLADPIIARDLYRSAEKYGASIPTIMVTDSVKLLGEKGDMFTLRTLERDLVRLVQTPQCFNADVLRRAHAECEETVTDDSAMVEAIGEEVAIVDGSIDNLKITHPQDLQLVTKILHDRKRDAPE